MAAITPKCTVGNKLCGKRCIPREHTCGENENEEKKPVLNRNYKIKSLVGMSLLIGASMGVGMLATVAAKDAFKAYSPDYSVKQQQQYAKSAKLWALAGAAGSGLLMSVAIAGRLNHGIVGKANRKELLDSKQGKNISRVLSGTRVEEGFGEMLQEAEGLKHDEAVAMKMDSYHDEDVGIYLAAKAKETLGPEYKVAYYPSGERKGLYVYKTKAALTALNILSIPVPGSVFIGDFNKSLSPEGAQIIF